MMDHVTPESSGKLRRRKPARGAARSSLQQIANLLGISVSTVSRGLRGMPGVRPALVEQIKKVALDMNYEQRHGMEAREALNILVLSQISNQELDTEYLAGVSKRSIEANATIYFHQCHPDECGRLFDPVRMPWILKDGKLDGILLFHNWPEDVVGRLRSLCPVVSVNHEYPDVDTVGIDEFSGMLGIVDHLLETGCRKIGFYGACTEVTWAVNRLAAFAGAMAVRNIRLPNDCIVEIPASQALSESEFHVHDGLDTVRRVSSGGLDAWVCPSHTVGMSLVTFLQDRRFSVPADVSVTGFQNIPTRGPRGHRPLLTTTSVSGLSIGAAAVDHLIQRISGLQCERRRILLPCRVVPGASTHQNMKPAKSS